MFALGPRIMTKVVLSLQTPLQFSLQCGWLFCLVHSWQLEASQVKLYLSYNQRVADNAVDVKRMW